MYEIVTWSIISILILISSMLSFIKNDVPFDVTL